MTGERALRAVISIFWVLAALSTLPAAFLLGDAIVTNEVSSDLWPIIIGGGIAPFLYFSVTASYLARGSQIARGFAIFSSLSGLLIWPGLMMGMMSGGVSAFVALLVATLLASPFLFSTWALIFHRGLRETLERRREKWQAAEKARLQALEDAMNEPAEK